MSELSTFLDDPSLFARMLSLLAPGFLISKVRSFFVARYRTSISSDFLNYAVYSTIYFSIVYPLISLSGSAYWFFFLCFLLPLFFGILIGVVEKLTLIRSLFAKLSNIKYLGWLSKVSSSYIDPLPLAWDHVFGRKVAKGCYIIVTLDSGERFFGRFEADSAASSDPAKQDLYIEEVLDFKFDRIDNEDLIRSVWIREDAIKFVEFIHVKKKEAK